MWKESQCPGCKKKFLNGRPYSIHITSCKYIDSAADIALNKHKITTAKKFEAKRAQKSALKELAAGQNQHASTSANQELFNNQDMDLDVKVSY